MVTMDKEVFAKFKQSGKILQEAREEIRSSVREGTLVIEICKKAERLLMKNGGRPAFPCNVSIDEVAAHYTSPPGDKSTIPEDSVVKVDIGVHVDGYVTDTAVTVCFNRELRSMVDAAEKALEEAVGSIRPGISTAKLGSVIEKTVKSCGFKPVSNLTGHEVGRYLVHAGTSIPNVSHISFSKIQPGRAYAIEPFVTLPNAAGRVENGKEVTIFRFTKRRKLKDPYAKTLLHHIESSFRTLPFAERWLDGFVPRQHHHAAFSELLSSKALMGYPVFIEASRSPVAQAEHTVLIVEDGCVVLT